MATLAETAIEKGMMKIIPLLAIATAARSRRDFAYLKGERRGSHASARLNARTLDSRVSREAIARGLPTIRQDDVGRF